MRSRIEDVRSISPVSLCTVLCQQCAWDESKPKWVHVQVHILVRLLTTCFFCFPAFISLCLDNAGEHVIVTPFYSLGSTKSQHEHVNRTYSPAWESNTVLFSLGFFWRIRRCADHLPQAVPGFPALPLRQVVGSPLTRRRISVKLETLQWCPWQRVLNSLFIFDFETILKCI